MGEILALKALAQLYWSFCGKMPENGKEKKRRFFGVIRQFRHFRKYCQMPLKGNQSLLPYYKNMAEVKEEIIIYNISI